MKKPKIINLNSMDVFYNQMRAAKVLIYSRNHLKHM